MANVFLDYEILPNNLFRTKIITISIFTYMFYSILFYSYSRICEWLINWQKLIVLLFVVGVSNLITFADDL